jgi:hypothetical protein
MNEPSETQVLTLQSVFSLIAMIWSQFWSCKETPLGGSLRVVSEKDRGSGGPLGVVSEKDRGSFWGSSMDEIPLGVICHKERELFVESFWWLLHRLSGKGNG